MSHARASLTPPDWIQGLAHDGDATWLGLTVELSSGVTFRDGRTSRPERETTTYAELIRFLTTHAEYEEKTDGPYLSPGLQPEGGKRRKATAYDAQLMGFDFDGPNKHGMSNWDIAAILCALRDAGIAYAAHTSHSHAEKAEPGRSRWRLWVFLSRRVNVSEYDRVWQVLGSWLGWRVDRAPRAINAVLYPPSCPPGAMRRWARHHHGGRVDVDGVLALGPTVSSPPPSVRGTGGGGAPPEEWERVGEIGDDTIARLTDGTTKALRHCEDGERVWIDKLDTGETGLTIWHPPGGRFLVDWDPPRRWAIVRVVNDREIEALIDRVTTDAKLAYDNATLDLVLDLDAHPGRRELVLSRLKQEAKVTLPKSLLNERRKRRRAEETQSRRATIREQDRRPRVLVTADEHLAIEQGTHALGRLPVFQRGGLLVEIFRRQGHPVIETVSGGRMRELLSLAARWERITEEGRQQVSVPAPVLRSVHERGHWPHVRELEGVVDAPVFLGDGRVLQRAGHDRASRFYKIGHDRLDLPAEPTREDARDAVITLLAVMEDFPFVADADQIAWLAALLTLVARPAIDGPCPLFLVTSNVRGSGKGLSVDVAHMIALGRPSSPTSCPSDDDEMRKRITALSMMGERSLVLDNIEYGLGTASLDAALTATRWKDRVLGSSHIYEGPLDIVWWGTGNNVQLRGDMTRRVLPIRLLSDHERPELRAGFRHPNLRGHVREHQRALLTAALTILRAFHVAGRPSQGLSSFGSYEAWSGLVREALAWTTDLDACETREGLVEAQDPVIANLGVLLEHWDAVLGDAPETRVINGEKRRLSRTGVVLRACVDTFSGVDRNLDTPRDRFREAFEALSGCDLQNISNRKASAALRRVENRVVSGRRLRHLPDTRSGGLWWVEQLPEKESSLF